MNTQSAIYYITFVFGYMNTEYLIHSFFFLSFWTLKTGCGFRKKNKRVLDSDFSIDKGVVTLDTS